MTDPDPDTAAAIAAALTETPNAALEDIAARAGVRVADVVRALPGGEATCVGGEHFVDVMQDIAGWGEVTFIVNTGDVIFEAKGQVPQGSLGQGYYNLHGAPIGGHLKADACTMIAFVTRRLFSSETRSVQFYSDSGGCMFKIYLGRDGNRALLPDQIARFRILRDSFAPVAA